MILPHPSTYLLALCCLAATVFAAPADDAHVLDDLVVIAADAVEPDPTAAAFTADALAVVAPWNAGDLDPLLPAAAINVNSRGESLLMIRGAPERHVTVTLDGIPLTVPWDERADLSLIPLDGIATLRASRGASDLLGGPNGVAGRLELSTSGRGPGREASLRAAAGGDLTARASWRGERSAWDWLAAASARRRDALTVPDGLTAPFHQADDRLRTNSDLRQASLLVRGERRGPDGSRDHVLLALSDAERGVPPEIHLDDGARLWRLPLVRRLLAGGGLERPLGERWFLAATAAVDVHAQDIRPFADDGYDETALAPGDDLEQGRDLTGHLRLGLRRDLGARSQLEMLIQGRATRHRERLTVDGPHLDYAQRLVATVVQVDAVPLGPLTLRLGVGLDAVATPASGDKPARDADTAPALLARVAGDLGDGARVHLAASRRSRFPSLRELYSGALGRFEPNPELASERQDLVEAGVAADGRGWEAGLTAFAAVLSDGIEKSSLGDGRFQRVNRSRIRTRGLELVLGRNLGGGWRLAAHHALLHARVDDGDGTPERPAEDRPDHQGSVLLEWRGDTGWNASVVGRWLGGRASADATDADDGLRDLDAHATWDLWLGKRIDHGRSAAVDLKIGVRNVADLVTWEQVGLPGAGRTWVAGVTVN